MIHDRIRRARVLKGYTLEALAYTDTGHIDDVAWSKDVSGNNITYSILIGVFKPELLKVAENTLSGRL